MIKRFEAYGGPEHRGSNPRMAEIRTTPGTYIIHHTHAYSTPTWPMSKIMWDTLLKDLGPVKDDVWYQLPSGKWASVKTDVVISDCEDRFEDLLKIPR